MELTAEGMSLYYIRVQVEETWGAVGPPTDTPWPPEDL
jgi:hypothetical protein